MGAELNLPTSSGAGFQIYRGSGLDHSTIEWEAVDDELDGLLKEYEAWADALKTPARQLVKDARRIQRDHACQAIAVAIDKYNAATQALIAAVYERTIE